MNRSEDISRTSFDGHDISRRIYGYWSYAYYYYL